MTSESEAADRFLRHIVSGPFWGDMPKSVGVAVSGGSDSMALLDLMVHWARGNEVSVHAVTVDHGLRVEARSEAERVNRFCADRDIPHSILTWGQWDGAGNLQARARDARYRLLADWSRECAVDVVAIGHTRDDQAETFLMRLARQAGVDGLAGMKPRFERNGAVFVRPLLSQSRQELRDYLVRQNIAWIADPSNEDHRFDRIKARKALVELERLGVTSEGLAQTAQNMRMASATLSHYTRQEAEKHVIEDHGDLIVEHNPTCPPEIERRLIVAGLQYVGGGVYSPRRMGIINLDLGLMESGSHTLAGCLVTKENRNLRITREFNAVAKKRSSINEVWDKRWRLTGPNGPDMEIGALGEDGIKLCPDWRQTGHPRASLLASPAVWRGHELVAAPMAGLENGWKAELIMSFQAFLLEQSR